MFSDVFLKLRILDILGITLDRVYGRITFTVGSLLLQGIETTGHLLRILGHWLLQVSTGRRYRTDESDGACSVVIQMNESRTSVEVRHDSGQVHRESIRSRQLLQTVGHLTQSLCPAGSRVGHQQNLQTHAAIILGDGHRRIYGCLTSGYRHVGCIGDNDRTFHQFTSRMRVYQFRELRKYLYDLIRTLTAGGDNHDIRFRLFRDSVLKHRLTRTERTGDKSGTTLNDRVHGIDRTNARLQQFEWTGLFLITSDGFLYRPFLDHRHVYVRAIFVRKDSHRIIDGVLSGWNHRLHNIRSLELKGDHNLMRLEILVHLSQPITGAHGIARFSQRLEIPLLIIVQRKRIIATFQEYTFHLVQVILQTVIVAGQHTRTQRNFQHMPLEFSLVADTHTTCALKYLYKGILSYHLDYFRHQLHASDRNVTDLILRNRTIHLYGY